MISTKSHAQMHEVSVENYGHTHLITRREPLKVTILKWHDAKLVDPEADGDYLIFPKGSGLRDCAYTAAGGWNTYIDEDGKPCRIRSEEDRENWKSYVRYWAYQPREVIELE